MSFSDESINFEKIKDSTAYEVILNDITCLAEVEQIGDKLDELLADTGWKLKPNCVAPEVCNTTVVYSVQLK